MKFCAIIQARRGSTRLPDKVMKPILGIPMLLHVIRRIQRSKLIAKVYLATTDLSEDQILGKIVQSANVQTFFGSANDVLDRYYRTAVKFGIDYIVRITADCPLIDPSITDKTIEKFLEGNYDYVSNAQNPTFPDGLDTEVFTFNTLEKAWKNAKMSSEREHVTPYIWKNPLLFKLGEFSNNSVNLSHMRWTVDNKEDLNFVRRVYRHLYPKNPNFDYHDVLTLLERHPKLMQINNNITRNEGYNKSLKKDRLIKKCDI